MSYLEYISMTGFGARFFDIGFLVIFTKITFVENSQKIKILQYENQGSKDPFGDFYHDQFGVITHFGGFFHRPAIV